MATKIPTGINYDSLPPSYSIRQHIDTYEELYRSTNGILMETLTIWTTYIEISQFICKIKSEINRF